MATSHATLNEIFSSNIRKYRKMRGLSQAKLEDGLGLSRYHVCLLESGNNVVVSTKLLQKLASEFNVPVKALFMEENTNVESEDAFSIADVLNTSNKALISCINSKIGCVDIKATFAKNLKRIREEKGFTVDDLAMRTGVNRGYLRSVEQGKVLAKIDVAGKLSEVLGVPGWKFYEENDETEVAHIAQIKNIIQTGMAEIIDKIQKLQ